MFDSICIRNQSPSDVSIDLGFLAEAMLFYSDVLVFAREHIIEQLAKGCGPAILIELLESGHLRLCYEYELTGIQTRASGSPHERHSGVRVHSPNHALQHVAPRVFEKVTGKSGKGRRLANRFSKHVESITRGPDALTDFDTDLLEKGYVQSIVGQLIQHLAPEYKPPNPLVFEVYKDGEEYAIESNVDFLELNRSYHLHVPTSHSSMSQAYLLSFILTARDNLYFASTLNADLALDPMNSQVLVTKVNGILDGYKRNLSQLGTFQDSLFGDGRAISEVINSGQRSFKELLRVLERAEKFRTWLKTKPPEIDLAKEYFREVTKSTWVDKLPVKSFRWAFFTGAGFILDAMGAGGAGTATGLVLSAADTFILDRIIKGWKPNQFIEGPLLKFVKLG